MNGEAITSFYVNYPSVPHVDGTPVDIYGDLLRTGSTWKVKKIGTSPAIPEFQDFQNMLARFSYVNMIPICDYRNTFYGFVLRSPSFEQKAFKILSFCEALLYGLESFKDFTYGKPILLVEGVKDCEAVKMVYPYCLSYLSSFPSNQAIQILKKLSPRLAIISDNDHVKEFVKKKANENGIHAFAPVVKDLGMYYEGSLSFPDLTLFIRSVLDVIS